MKTQSVGLNFEPNQSQTGHDTICQKSPLHSKNREQHAQHQQHIEENCFFRHILFLSFFKEQQLPS